VIEAIDFCPNSSPYSSEVSATTTDSTAPTPPTSLNVASAGTEPNITYTLSWTVSSDDGNGADDVVAYRVYGDSTLLTTLGAGVTTYDTTTTCSTYSVSAVDNCGNESDPAIENACEQTPAVTITTPTSGATVSGTVTVEGTATVPDGRTLSSLQIQIGSGDWINITTITPWSYTWNTSEIENGDYTITVTAVDSNGCSDSDSISVTVDNSSSPDNAGPTIENITQNPSIVALNDQVEVCADIIDPSGVASVILNSSEDGDIPMTLIEGETYKAIIPKHNNQTVSYYITAEDTLGNQSTSTTYEYTQH